MKSSFNHYLAAVLLAVTAFINMGCAKQPTPTVAQQQYQSIEVNVDSIGAETLQCKRAIYDSPDFDPLRSHIPPNIENPSLDQLTNESKATKQEIAALRIVHSKLHACEEAAVQKLSEVLPAMAIVTKSLLSQNEAATIDLIKKKISWGEFILRRKNALISWEKAASDEHKNIVSELNQQHSAELAQRQAEQARKDAKTAAIVQFLQNQQALNRANRPVTTNCNRLGNSINCTSY